jgi:SAM-dependent methyltransferase
LYWYRKLYAHVFDLEPGFEHKQVLEVGSGMSPLKLFYPHVTTSDVLDLEYLDHVFDCHEIDQYGAVLDHSLDIVTATNVLHHLSSPLEFMVRAAAKLKPQGELVLVEPYCSLTSYLLYRIFHHEGISFDVDYPCQEKVEGPLSSANQALPHMMFFTRPKWLERLEAYYDLSRMRLDFFSSVTYMATGGVSHVFPVPHFLYRALFPIDTFLARAAPRVFASFFITRLTTKGIA